MPVRILTAAVAGCVLAAVVCAASPRTAAAQEAPDGVSRARELFVQGGDLRDHGDLRGALEKLEAAHALAVNPITTFELARTYAALGMLVEARDAYASIARLPVQADETERATQARRDGAQAAGDLQSRVPTREVEPLAVPPATPAPNVPPTQAAASSPAEAPPPAPDPSGNHLGPFGYAGFGVGAVGFVVGTILAGATLSKATSIQCTTASCEQSAADAAHSTRDLGLAAIVSYSVAGVGAAIGVADVLLYRRSPASRETGLSVRPWIGAGAAGLHGSF